MHTTHRRLPRAGIDRLDDRDTALAAVAMALHQPLRHETIVLLLDETRCGRAIVVIDQTCEHDAVIEIVEFLTHGVPDLGAVVVASVRPPTEEAANIETDRSDVDRWLEMSEIAEQSGVELLEWFVIGTSIVCPRDTLGEAPRW